MAHLAPTLAPAGPQSRRCFSRLLLATCFAAAATAAAASEFPSRPIRLVVPLAPGGTTDIVARVVAEHAGRQLGQPIVVDNRPGAGGTIGSHAVASAPADGYTILMGTIGTLAVLPSINRKLPYDSDNAFAPVSLVSGGQFALVVHPSVPATNLQQFVKHVRSHPGALSYGSAGNGSTLHLGMELLKSLTSTDMVHVPYKGSGPMVMALAAGEVKAGLPDVPSALPFIKAGKLRAIAVTGSKRALVAPEIPTVAESGVPDYELVVWLGILAPAGTPKPVIHTLNAAIVHALKDPSVREQLARIDTTVYASSPEEFAAFLKRERAKWDPIVKASGATMN